MTLLASFTVIPFAISIMAFSLSVACVIFYFYMYKRLIDLKYLLRLFLITSIAIYFLFENLYFIFFINDSATKTHIYIYIFKEIVSLFVVLAFFVAMKEISYKNFLRNNMLNTMSNILTTITFIILIVAIIKPSYFANITTSYLNIYQNRINLYGIGSLFIIKDIVVAFTLTLNIVILTYIILFAKAKVTYNIFILGSTVILLLAFLDDSHALYFFYHKSKHDFYLSRTSFGLFLFLIALLSTSILRILDNLKKINLEKDIANSKVGTETEFIKNTYEMLDETIVLKNELCNISMFLINISRSTREYVSILRKKLELSYENSKNFIQYEYGKQSTDMYNEYTFNKLCKSFLGFNATIDKTKEYIHKITDIMICLKDMSSTITNAEKNALKEIENYSSVSKDKTEIMLSHFKKNISFNQLSMQIKRALIVMKNISERISTLSVNSSIQSSKSGGYLETFSFVSKEMVMLVNDTTDASAKLEYILLSVSSIFKDFSNAKNNILENISNLNNNISSLHLSIETIPEAIISEDENNAAIIDNNRAIETLTENIVFLLKDEIDNCQGTKEEIKSILANFFKMETEMHSYRKKIHSSMYDVNKIDTISNELNLILLEFDRLMRKISEFLDTLL